MSNDTPPEGTDTDDRSAQVVLEEPSFLPDPIVKKEGLVRRLLAQWRFGLKILVSLAAIVVTIDAVTSLFSIGTPLHDRSAPLISSDVSFERHYCFTKVIPNIHVEDPDPGFEERSGLKSVKLYVGGELVGDWPVPGIRFDFDLEELRHTSFATTRYGPVVTVAEDRSGNVRIEQIKPKEGSTPYPSPLCYAEGRADDESCDCRGFPVGQVGP